MISASPVPENALHKRYREEGGYADCYTVQVSQKVDLPTFVEAFYTSPLFKVERFILKWLIDKPSTDEQARDLALGKVDNFSAWTMEAREPKQLLMKDYRGMTLSWFMVEGDGPCTLYFGSAIVRAKRAGRGTGGKIPLMFRATLWFHRLYSRALLWSAVNGL